jgi:hypothetical protein
LLENSSLVSCSNSEDIEKPDFKGMKSDPAEGTTGVPAVVSSFTAKIVDFCGFAIVVS